ASKFGTHLRSRVAGRRARQASTEQLGAPDSARPEATGPPVKGGRPRPTPIPKTRELALGRLRVTNGCADNTSGTSEVPQLADQLCAMPKSAEVGQDQKSSCFT